MILGTDFSILDFARARDEIDRLNLRPGPKRKLLRDNALALYGLA